MSQRSCPQGYRIAVSALLAILGLFSLSAEPGDLIKTLGLPDEEPVVGFAFGDGDELVLGGADGTVQLIVG